LEAFFTPSGSTSGDGSYATAMHALLPSKRQDIELGAFDGCYFKTVITPDEKKDPG
jgi:hypothetical protein